MALLVSLVGCLHRSNWIRAQLNAVACALEPLPRNRAPATLQSMVSILHSQSDLNSIVAVCRRVELVERMQRRHANPHLHASWLRRLGQSLSRSLRGAETLLTQDCQGASSQSCTVNQDGGWSAWTACNLATCPSDFQTYASSVSQRLISCLVYSRTCDNPAPRLAER